MTPADPPPPSALRRWLALALIALLFGANVWRAIELRLPWEPPGWVLVGVPPVISQLQYGHPHDYTTLTAVKTVFEARPGGYEPIDAAIADAMALDPSSIDRSWELLGADDKGIVDYVWISFKLFGPNVAGLIWTYFLLLGVSCAVFVARFWKHPWALLIAAAFLAAHVAVLPTLPINPQLAGLLISRALSPMTILAFLHLTLEVVLFWSRGFERRSIPFGVAQVAFIIFTLHITTRTGWQILGISLLAPLVLLSLSGPVRRRLHSTGWLTPSAPLGLWALVALWPIAALWVGQVGLETYKNRVYAAAYFQGNTASHVFWHSIFMGLSAHPDLARELDLRVSDVAVIAATGRFLLAEGRRDEWVAMGGESPRFRDIRWGLHDQGVREMLVATCRKEPVPCLTAVAWYKPRYVVEYLLWFMRWQSDIPAPHMLSDILRDQYADMTRRSVAEGKQYDLRRLDLLLAVGALAALLARSIMQAWRPLALLLVVGLVGATLPSLIAYPIAHTLTDVLVMVGVAMYVLVGVGVGAAAGWLEARLRASRPD